MHNQDGTTGLAGHKHSLDPVARKQELLREGEFFRSNVAHARAQIRHAARPEVMLHSTIDHATWALRARADALLKPTGTSVSVLMPYGLALFNFIRQRKLGKPAGAAAILLGVAGWYMNKRRVQQNGLS
ncbi:hypothetical protein ACWV27_09520 [Massilia varians]|jgi:hypothetical protein|uniref:hypothetical protein n=1 Tax=Massilia TaxID=149698 RepID=UPI000407EC15|nr:MULTISPECIES: hypothetical protein [Massilia]KFC62599.1 hypothetical protein FG94_04642 [Massilia sp. LC238]MDK6078867.1 hypothetical protein [Massilia varians]